MAKILTPLAGWASDEKAAAASFSIGKDLGWFVEGLHIRQNLASVMPVFGEGVTITGVKELVGAIERSSEEQAANAVAVFKAQAEAAGAVIKEAFCKEPGFAARFEEWEGYPAEEIAKRARLSDIVVFEAGSVKPTLVFDDALNQVLLGARRSCYLAATSKPDLSRPVVIAWDGSTESANALMASKPFLAHASAIFIAQIENAIDFGDRGISDCAWADEYIRLNGWEPEVAQLSKDKGERTAEALNDFAGRIGAGLIVMGAFGHSRLREAIIGGVTVNMIETSDTSLLLAH